MKLWHAFAEQESEQCKATDDSEQLVQRDDLSNARSNELSGIIGLFLSIKSDLCHEGKKE